MNIGLLLRGFVLGFSIAMPVGPIGVLCMQRTLAQGRAAGLASGLGAATADAVYGSVAGFGLTVVSAMLVRQRTWLGLVGGVFLCYLGLKTLLARPAEQTGSESKGGLPGAYASTFLLTLTNPLTIFSFTFAFAALGGGSEGDYVGASLLVLGVFAGSGLWWLLLSGAVNLFRARVDLKWVNRISGTLITGLGLIALWGLMR